MTNAVEIFDDPAHPQGGRAVILFENVAFDRLPTTLLIEVLTEGYDYRGPTRLDIEGRATSTSYEIVIGPDVVGALAEGLAVRIALAGTPIEADVLWPILTPPPAPPRRRPMRAAPIRVVADAGPGPRGERPERVRMGGTDTPLDRRPDQVERIDPDRTIPNQTPVDTTPEPRSEKFDQSPALLTVPGETDAVPGGDTTVMDATAEVSIAKDEPQAERLAQPQQSSRTRGLRAVAAVAVPAFLVGVGTTGLAWFMSPRPEARTATGEIALPSVYATLSDLPRRAPDGTSAELGDASSFRQRSEHATSPEDASYWARQAMHALVTSKTNDAAAILNDFADNIAAKGKDKPSLAAARLVWEMAAAGNDCAAMENIAAATSEDAASDADTAAWRARADTCRSKLRP